MTRAQIEACVGWLVNLSHARPVYSYSDRSLQDEERPKAVRLHVWNRDSVGSRQRYHEAIYPRPGGRCQPRADECWAIARPMLFNELGQENEAAPAGVVVVLPWHCSTPGDALRGDFLRKRGPGVLRAASERSCLTESAETPVHERRPCPINHRRQSVVVFRGARRLLPFERDQTCDAPA